MAASQQLTRRPLLEGGQKVETSELRLRCMSEMLIRL